MSKLWYRKPAIEWEEALPLGNGRLGAMVYGIPDKEHIQVNEESIWYGGPVNRNNPDLKKYLPEIRELIFKGEISKAERLMFLAMSGCPNSAHPSQTLGDIILEFEGLGEVTDYRRELDLEKALCTVSFVSNGVSYQREIFVSKPADCMLIRVRADKRGSINLWVGMDRWKFYDGICADGDNGLYLYGNLGRGASEFAMKLQAKAIGGKVYTIGERLMIEEADEVILTFTADTTYQYGKEEKEAAIAGYQEKNIELPYMVGLEGKSVYEMEELRLQQALQAMLLQKMHERIVRAGQKDFDKLLEEHIADYQSLFGRMEFVLVGSTEFDKLPTDERIQAAGEGTVDFGLSQLYFDFGRYLLIACSREGGLPATLQGIWNKDILPPWDCKYTININTQMNYWLAENCNLSECHMPLFDLIEKMVKNGRRTAREMYGCRGFMCHHNTDINGDTATQDLWIPGSYWVMGAAWLCTHQWTHFEYTQDVSFLQKQFPIMCEAALFFLDFLVEKDGYLVTCPSVSPENTYVLPSGEKGANGYGVTMDNQILRDLFGQCMKGFAVLQKEDALSEEVLKKLSEAEITDVADFIKQVEKACSGLKPTQIGSDGRILEWQEEYEEWEPGHRHISHLYGMHPSEQITMDDTPELAAAARKTLEYRLSHGGGHTGWSRAWIINHYAKLWDGETAYENIEQLFGHSTYPNLFDKHPPFQIDGNFGATAAMAEMLLQSTMQRVVLLPALPKAWESGSMKGIRMKGNAEADIDWEQGKLKQCVIRAEAAWNSKARYQDKVITLQLAAGEEKVLTVADFVQ
ncbi:MAG: glycoside hydrolase family 95 protein [Lachnospiraceae bacterium]|nr:glycoside hydrolase family 95 protein [Lachnospiraceae bacterium]